MSVTLQAIYDKSRRLDNTNSTTQSDASLLTDTNETYLEILRELAKNKIEVTGVIAHADLQADQSEYQFPDDLLELVRVEINYSDPTDYRKWRKMSETDLANLPAVWKQYVKDNMRDLSTFDVFGDHIYTAPQPDSNQSAALRIWYIKKNTDFTAASDVLSHPFNLYWEVFAYGNAWKYFEQRNTEEAERKRALYEKKLASMVSELSHETTEPIKTDVPNYFNQGWM